MTARLPTQLLRLRAPMAVLALLTCLGLSACGAARRVATAGPSRPSAAAPLVGSDSAGWAFLAGPSHDGESAATGPQSAQVRWRRNLGAPVVPGPVISRAGVAYVAANNGVLHAIDVHSGHDRWSFHAGAGYGSDLSTGPLLLPSGEILWPGPNQRLYALTGSGRLLWSLPAGAADLTTPVIDPRGGELVVADMSGAIAAYRLGDATRRPTRLWSRQLAHGSYGNPVVAADGTIYQTSGDCLFALTPDGHVKWSVTTPQSVEVSPAIATNGIVVFGSNNRLEYGVDPNGHVRWTEKIGDFTYSSPLALPGRRVLFGNHIGQMTVLDSDTGRVIRRDQGAGQLWTAAAVDAHGDVYFASRTGGIYGFGSAGQKLFDLKTATQFDSYPALAPDGTLLVGATDGTLYALGGSSS